MVTRGRVENIHSYVFIYTLLYYYVRLKATWAAKVFETPYGALVPIQPSRQFARIAPAGRWRVKKSIGT